MRRRRRDRLVALAVLACVLIYGLACVGDPLTSARAAVSAAARADVGNVGAPSASRAAVLSVSDEGHLHVVRESGSLIVEEGVAKGTLPGSVKVSFNVGAVISASFTISTRGGSISGHGSGKLHSTGLYSSFGGSLVVTRGTGRFAHANGSGGLYGAINRRTYALTVQTIGKLHY